MSRNEDGTRVDLGDDLLEPTRTLQVPKKSKQTDAAILDPKDLLESAKIYLSEGFLNDAKKILHKLWVAPEAAAFKKQIQKVLNEIQTKELELILKSKKEKAPPKPPSVADTDEILRKLESDLKIDDALPGLRMEVHAADFTVKDLIDLTIAFSEMGRMEEAKKTITAALTLNPLSVEVHCLYAEVHLALRDFYPAIESLQAALAESEIEICHKSHLMYFMGRLREETKAIAESTFWYQQTLNIDESYRDAAERLKRLLR